MSKQTKKKKGLLDYALVLVMIVALGVFLYSAYNLVVIQKEYQEGEETYEPLQVYVQEQDEDDSDSRVGETEGQEGQAPEVLQPELHAPISVEFQQLREVNKDIVGWIYMEAIPAISYPIVLGEDNTYYLKHTVEGKRNSSASIFMDYRNRGDFTDINTIVYGHNMKNQSMFGRLKQYKKAETVAASPYFWILTPEGSYRYEIFSVREVSERDDVYALYKYDVDGFKTYLETTQAASVVPFAHTFDGTEKIVTLSTCTTNSSRRCVVQGFYRAQ